MRQNASSYDLHASEWAKNIGDEAGHKYLEKPAMEKELPQSLEGKICLCIGVGSGDEIGEIKKKESCENCRNRYLQESFGNCVKK